jgi:cysteine synthase A
VDTPLQPLTIAGREVLCKLEGLNPSGSHKDRPARALVESLRAGGRLTSGAVCRLLVSSSGNFARAVAHHTAAEAGVEVVVVTDVLSPAPLIRGLQVYPHVRVIVVNEPDATGSHLLARKRVIRDLLAGDPASIFLDQYDNPLIPAAYEQSLAPEIERQAPGRLRNLFVPVGTGATLSGLLRHRRKSGRGWRAFAVDAEGSGLFRPPRHGTRRGLSGYGNGHPTGLLREAWEEIDHVVYVADREALLMCRWLMRRHGLCVGPSSGATLAAVAKVAARRRDLLPPGELSLAILPDRGDCYGELLNDTRPPRSPGAAPSEGPHAVPTPAAV